MIERERLAAEIARFDPAVAIERAATPPASWYLEPAFLEAERATTFRRSWVLACRADEVARPGDCVAVEVAGDPYLVVRGADGALRGFHNACRHHGARLVADRAACGEIVCPYHGWTYSLAGALASAPRSAGIAGFRREDFGLVPVAVEAWGPLVLLHAGAPERAAAEELAPLDDRLDPAALARMTWFARRRYAMQCNWKVFVDNYLDGGYHVPHLHSDLAQQLDLATYATEVFARCSVQQSAAGGARRDRIGAGAVYAWIHPNLMLNRYGRVLDVNLVVPLAADRCEVVFDFWYDGDPAADRALLEASLASSERTQLEDVRISEEVQRGLRSVAYDRGRYAPAVEHAMHHFHRLLAADLRNL